MSLPAGWAEFNDPSTGNPYFHNAATAETTWTRPVAPADGGFGAAPAQPMAAAAPMQDFQQQLQPQPQLQPQQFQPQGALPPGWNEYNDPTTGNPYYNNAGTGETTWTRPAAVAAMGGFGAAPPAQLMMVGGEAWLQGIVKNWDDEKGFGFIDPVAGGDNVFVHRSSLLDGSILEKGGNVQFVLSWNANKNKHQVSKCTGAKQQAGAMPGQPFGQPLGMGQPAMAAASQQPPEGAQASGTVKTWFDDKGFGFITPSDGSKDCYVHRTFLLDGGSLVVGSTVQYTIQFDPAKNKNNATKVTGAVPGDGKGGGPPGGGKGGAPMPAGLMGAPGGGFGQVPSAGFGDVNRFSPYQPV